MPCYAGGYYYHDPSPFANYEEALKAVKADAEARSIPFRYSQWDDWCAFETRNQGGRHTSYSSRWRC